MDQKVKQQGFLSVLRLLLTTKRLNHGHLGQDPDPVPEVRIRIRDTG
jgi:hypothetical protein